MTGPFRRLARALALATVLVAPLAAAQQPREADPAALVRQLGHARYHRREDAMRRLVALGGKARDALRAAQDHADPEIRWRARLLFEQIAPLDSYYKALALVEEGKLKEAMAGVKRILPALPPGARPHPPWALEMIGEVEEQRPTDGASLNSGIDWHNVMCLLTEAGIDCPNTRQRAIDAYRRIPMRDARANRLLAVALWEHGKQDEARAAWKAGTVAKEDMTPYLWYDEAEWLAVRGHHDKAVAALATGIEGMGSLAEEADVASDFYMLRGQKAFEELIARHRGEHKLPPAVITPEARKRQRERTRER